MSTPVNEAFWALTEKEKQTLRLIVRGHDAKSIARILGLSVHTINERLREARRKMAVSSSREAARVLLEAEYDSSLSPTPEWFGDREIGDDAKLLPMKQENAPTRGAERQFRRPWMIIGGIAMTFLIGILALVTLSQVVPAPPPTPSTAETAMNSEVVNAARQWLVLGDQGRWKDGYRETGTAFRKLNTERAWASASEHVRVPLGEVISREFLGEEKLPAPPHGYEVVKFRTRFANKADAVETVTLQREDGYWRVVGVTIA